MGSIMRRSLLSLAAVVLGWAAGMLYFLAYGFLLSPWGRPTDLEALAYWTGVFCLLAWLIAALPISLFVHRESWFFASHLAPFTGAAAGLILFGGLVGWWTDLWTEPLYLGYAAVIGAAANLGYSLLANVRLRSSSKKEPDHVRK